MIENFEKVKTQLVELAKILNSFQSEAVQLRLLEILLSDDVSGHASGDAKDKTPKRKARRKSKVAKTADKTGSGGNTKKRGRKKVGGYAMVEKLLEEGFFEEKRTAKDIIEHCKTSKATIYKTTDFSGKLGNLTSQGKLKRDKNSDNQYEYRQE